MFSFVSEQKVWKISDICFGGQPGRYPTVLFGGLFFKGEPDFKKGEKQIENMMELSKKTGNPCVADFFIRKSEYVDPIIGFIKDKLPKNMVFSVDIIDPEIKITVLETLGKNKLFNRTIYNSIHVGTTEEEQKTLKRYTPEMAIVVAFNPKDKSPDGKIEVRENGANLTSEGLLDIAKSVGIEKILVDTAALAPGDYSGAAIAGIPVIKEEYGLPTGCAIHNVVEKSKWLDSFENVRKPVDAA